MARGRKPITDIEQITSPFYAKLATLAGPGEYLLLDYQDIADLRKHQGRVSVQHGGKRPAPMREWTFKTEAYTAINQSDPGKVVYILRIERTK